MHQILLCPAASLPAMEESGITIYTALPVVDQHVCLGDPKAQPPAASTRPHPRSVQCTQDATPVPQNGADEDLVVGRSLWKNLQETKARTNQETSQETTLV